MSLATRFRPFARLIRARKRQLLVVRGLLLVGGGIVVFRSKPSFVPIQASVQLLPADSLMPRPRASLFERTVPLSWGWLWRLRERFRGPQATISIDARILDCTGVSEKAISGLVPKLALAETNGLRGWILEGSALTNLQQQLTQKGAREIMHPRVNTAHGIQSAMSVGTPVSGTSLQTGAALNLLSLVQPDGMALMTVLTLTEAITNRTARVSEAQRTAAPTVASGRLIVTNLASAAWLKLPEGFGFFMLGPDVSNDSRRIGVIVSASVQRPK